MKLTLDTQRTGSTLRQMLAMYDLARETPDSVVVYRTSRYIRPAWDAWCSVVQGCDEDSETENDPTNYETRFSNGSVVRFVEDDR